jgi:hypothetical protein
MLFFPQLNTGAIAQYPVRKQVRRRTLTNYLLDGGSVKLADSDANSVSWELSYSGLTDTERARMEEFFLETDGPLKTFVFPDPTGNLLRWSEDLSKNVWEKDGLLQVETLEEGIRVVNGAQVAQGWQQTVATPAAHYCFSSVARSETITKVTVKLGGLTNTLAIGPEWTQISCSGLVPGESEETVCRIEIEAGAAIEFIGFQLEAQPQPSAYKRTTEYCGLYERARFADDELYFRADGVDDHAVTIRLIAQSGPTS